MNFDLSWDCGSVREEDINDMSFVDDSIETMEFGNIDESDEETELIKELMVDIIDEDTAIDLLHKLGFLNEPEKIEMDSESASITAIYPSVWEPKVVTIDLAEKSVWTTDATLRNTVFRNRLRDNDIIEKYLTIICDCRLEGIEGKAPLFFRESYIPEIKDLLGDNSEEIANFLRKLLNLEGIQGFLCVKFVKSCIHVLLDDEFVCVISNKGIEKVNELFPITNQTNEELLKIFWEWSLGI